MQLQNNAINQALHQINGCLAAGDPHAAEALATEFVANHPSNADGWILLGRAYLDLVRFSDALEASKKATSIAPDNAVARLLKINALLWSGHLDEAFAEAGSLENDKKYDPVIAAMIGRLYTQTNRHSDAIRCYERVRILQPSDRNVVFNICSSHIALGDLEKAERLLEDLIRKDPADCNAHYNRSALRKQTRDRNHIEEMERILARPLPGEDSEPLLCYALAKELEDLGEWEKSFSYLRRGADARRRSMNYRVEDDIAMLEKLATSFSADFFNSDLKGYEAESPFFVVGLPRSGTTLVDRILSSHSSVGSVGETGEFSIALARRERGNAKTGLIEIENVNGLDYESLGRDYCRSVNAMLPGYTHVLDKTPSNFHYIGMILTALPNAKIVHLRRHPVDSCYAVYKTLFRKGYLYSYDLEELGRYYLAYRDLMAHWREVLPGRFLDVRYEELVDSQERITRDMLKFCDLEWEDACLSFEKNASPSLTASAAQVRRPIYKTSVALWRRYERELQPLIRVLRDGGVDVD